MYPFGQRSVAGDGMGHGRVPPAEMDTRRYPWDRANTEENVEHFTHHFKEELSRLNDFLELAERLYKDKKNYEEGKSNPEDQEEIDRLDLEYKDILSAAGERLTQLSKNITTSTRFLPKSLIKTYQEEVREFGKRYQETRDRLMPKKKFGFTARTKKEAKDKTDSNEEQSATAAGESSEQKDASASKSKLTVNIHGYTERYIFDAGNCNNREIDISDLESCFIEIRGHPACVRLNNLVKCVVICGPTTHSVTGEKCHQNIFAFACQQFRFTECMMNRIFLHVIGRPVIEYCLDLEFGCYNYKYDNIEQDFKDAGLNIKENHYTEVGDFNWLSKEVPSPFWYLSTDALDWNKLKEQFKEQVMKSEGPIEFT